MATVILLVHLMVAAALVGVVLLQRSEGGALGIGGGGGGGFLTGRGTANLLTRATAILAAVFFTTSILLSLLAQRVAPTSIFDQQPGTTAPASPSEPASEPGTTKAPEGGGGVLDKLRQGQGQSPVPSVPQNR